MAQRRSSYASILSAAVNSSSPTSTDPPRSGFLSQMVNPSGVSTTTASHPVSHSYQYRNYATDHSHHQHGSSLDGVGRGSHLPLLQESYNQGFGVASTMDPLRGQDGFVPPYLRGTRFAERLKERKEAKRSIARDGKSGRSSAAGSLSTSNSNLSLHKMPMSHRSVQQDAIERPSNAVDEGLQQLPFRWNPTDKSLGLEIVDIDGLEVKFSLVGKSQDDAAAIRADHPIPKECGIYYFEITIEGKIKESLIAIGFSAFRAPLNRLPGWEQHSWAYHGDDGYTFRETASGKPYGPQYGSGDVIGCGINFKTRTAFFTKNGHLLGTAFRELPIEIPLYPSVGMKKLGEQIKANFGQTDFIYDIVGHVSREKDLLIEDISNADLSTINEGRSEHDLMRELISQYLAHQGFIETSKAFSADVRRADVLLKRKADFSSATDHTEDLDAVERQKIRQAVLEGDIDRAIKHTDLYYPTVLKNNEYIYFKLRCQKFVEMIRRCSELNPAPKEGKGRSSSAKSISNGHTELHSREEGIFEDGMELDGQANEEAIVADDIEMEGLDSANGSSRPLQSVSMKDCLIYGQELQSEFKSDPRREVKQALEDTFALIAYPDAGESSLAPLLRTEGRVPVAEELNSAILVSTGKASSAALEHMCQQTEVLMIDLAQLGHGAALLHMQRDFMR